MTQPASAPPSTLSLLAGLDLAALYVATGVALVISLLVTLRARSLQGQQGKPLTPWSAVIVDALIGALIGGLGALTAAYHVASVRNGPSLLLLAGLVGAFAPKITDWLQDNGIGVLKRLIRQFVAGVGKALDEEEDEKDDDPKTPAA